MAKTKKLSAKEIAAKVDEFGRQDGIAKTATAAKSAIGEELKEITEAGTTLLGDTYKAVIGERANREADIEKVLDKLFEGDWKKMLKSGVVEVSITELGKKFGAEQIDRVCNVLEPTKTITPKRL